MIKGKVVSLLAFSSAVLLFSNSHVIAGESNADEVRSEIVVSSSIATLKALPISDKPRVEIELPDEVVVEEEEKEVLDFTNQQVIFDVNDFEDPVVFEDCHVTTYCNCEKCCGKYAWRYTTSTGATTEEGVTVAVDPKVIPYGSIVELDGHFYIAQDCGGGIKGVEIDVYIEDVGGKHTRCYQFMKDLGKDYGNTIRVWIPKEK